jgi:hypothetical protein
MMVLRVVCCTTIYMVVLVPWCGHTRLHTVPLVPFWYLLAMAIHTCTNVMSQLSECTNLVQSRAVYVPMVRTRSVPVLQYQIWYQYHTGAMALARAGPHACEDCGGDPKHVGLHAHQRLHRLPLDGLNGRPRLWVPRVVVLAGHLFAWLGSRQSVGAALSVSCNR